MVMIWPKGLSLVKVKDNLSIVYNGHQKASEVTVEILPGACLCSILKLAELSNSLKNLKLDLCPTSRKEIFLIIYIHI